MTLSASRVTPSKPVGVAGLWGLGCGETAGERRGGSGEGNDVWDGVGGSAGSEMGRWHRGCMAVLIRKEGSDPRMT